MCASEKRPAGSCPSCQRRQARAKVAKAPGKSRPITRSAFAMCAVHQPWRRGLTTLSSTCAAIKRASSANARASFAACGAMCSLTLQMCRQSSGSQYDGARRMRRRCLSGGAAFSLSKRASTRCWSSSAGGPSRRGALRNSASSARPRASALSTMSTTAARDASVRAGVAGGSSTSSRASAPRTSRWHQRRKPMSRWGTPTASRINWKVASLGRVFPFS